MGPFRCGRLGKTASRRSRDWAGEKVARVGATRENEDSQLRGWGKNDERAWEEHEDGEPARSGEWLSRMALSLLGCATCSVLDFVRTELRTMLAIAFSDRIDSTMQPLASRSQPHHPQ